MLLFYVTVSCVLFGSSAGIEDTELCYGRRFKLPFDYMPPVFRGQIYFTPSNGGSRKLVMDNGEAKDPRIEVFSDSVYFTDLKERDDGTYSISIDEDRQYDVIRLKILDCSEKITRYYGVGYSTDIPRKAEFLEFTPQHNVDHPYVLWNRTNPQTNNRGRGRVKHNVWKIINLTQADNGYYSFRRKDNTLVFRILLTVEENSIYYDVQVNERLLIESPLTDMEWNVNFTPEGEMEHITLMKEGYLVREGYRRSSPTYFTGRIQVVRDDIEIYPVESTDSGTFEFRDPQGNLAQTVQVKVQHEYVPTSVYIGVIVGIVFAVIVCCCCVRKCCCKKKSSKRDESAPQTAAAPAVYHRDQYQPAGPTYSAAPAAAYSYQQTNLLASTEPATTSLGPSVYNPVNIPGNPSQPEVGAPGGQGASPAPPCNSDYLSSNLEPRFELKGLTSTSAHPLTSDSTFSNVYTSDKLNFL